jgi:hypothetical protein
MTPQFVPYDPSHLAAYMPGVHPEVEAARAMVPGLSFTAMLDGRIIGLAGLLPQWPGRAIAWVLASNVPMRCWPAITRETIRVLEAAHTAGYRRIEMTARADDPPANRWALRLGFKPYAALWMYGPDGADHVGYVRLRGDA